MRHALVILAMACGRLNTTSPDGGAGNLAACQAQFESDIDDCCTGDSDCALSPHTDCCGNVLVGVSANDPSNPPVEAAYATCAAANCGATGCFHPDMAEDGKMASAGHPIVAFCDVSNLTCSSTVR